MRKIPTIEGESLDDAVNRLLEEKKRGRQVYLVFNHVNLLSDTVTLDSAYREVYGCSRERYFAKETKKIVFEEEKRIFKLDAKGVIDDIKVARMIYDFDPDTGRANSNMARDYIKDLSRYAVFCKDEVKEEWVECITYYVYSAGTEDYDDDTLEDILCFYEKLGSIMKAINDGNNWADIYNLVQSYKLSDNDMQNLKECMIHYAIHGEEFVSHIFGESKTLRNKNGNTN